MQKTVFFTRIFFKKNHKLKIYFEKKYLLCKPDKVLYNTFSVYGNRQFLK